MTAKRTVVGGEGTVAPDQVSWEGYSMFGQGETGGCKQPSGRGSAGEALGRRPPVPPLTGGSEEGPRGRPAGWRVPNMLQTLRQERERVRSVSALVVLRQVGLVHAGEGIPGEGAHEFPG